MVKLTASLLSAILLFAGSALTHPASPTILTPRGKDPSKEASKKAKAAEKAIPETGNAIWDVHTFNGTTYSLVKEEAKPLQKKMHSVNEFECYDFVHPFKQAAFARPKKKYVMPKEDGQCHAAFWERPGCGGERVMGWIRGRMHFNMHEKEDQPYACVGSVPDAPLARSMRFDCTHNDRALQELVEPYEDDDGELVFEDDEMDEIDEIDDFDPFISAGLSDA